MQALADLGLFGMALRPDDGGLGLGPAGGRHALRMLASGCGATAFAFAQHHGTTAAVASTANTDLRDHWLPKLRDDTLAGIAFAHLRREDRPVLLAEPDGVDGWTFSGSAPWVTSWGHAAVMSVAARTADDQIVWALLPMMETDRLTVSRRFDLAVYNATSTVALDFDRCAVAADQVLSVIDHGKWAARDRLLSSRPSPLCLGIGDRALTELAVIDADTAARFEPWWHGQTERAEAACVAVDDALRSLANIEDDDLIDLAERTAQQRSVALLATQQLCTALLSAVGGQAIDRSHIAQRLAREALFYVIQAQTSAGKAATLDRLSPPAHA